MPTPILRPSRSSIRPRTSPRQRKGIAVVMFAVFLTLLMMFVAIAADVSRFYVGRNALQTAADASAMAGAQQLLRYKAGTGTSDDVVDSAQTYGAKHGMLDVALAGSDVVVTHEDWEDGEINVQGHLNPRPADWDAVETDAVQTVVSKYVTFHFAPIFGINGATATARAVGWAGASVQGTEDCVKPWAVPIQILRDSIHSYDPDLDDVAPQGALTQAEADALDRMVAENSSKLNFVLKQGTGSPDYNAGNFFNVVLPRVCEAETQTCSDSTSRGAQNYYDNIYDEDYPGGCKPGNQIAVGDILETQPGVSPQQTILNTEAFCQAQGFDSCDGVPIKAAFFATIPDGSDTWDWMTEAGYNLNQSDRDAGRFPMEVRVMGAFILTGISKEKDKSQLTGRFTKLDDSGPAGPTPSLLRTIMLVK